MGTGHDRSLWCLVTKQPVKWLNAGPGLRISSREIKLFCRSFRLAGHVSPAWKGVLAYASQLLKPIQSVRFYLELNGYHGRKNRCFIIWAFQRLRSTPSFPAGLR